VTDKLHKLTVLCSGEMLKSRSNVNYTLYHSFLSRCNSLKIGHAFIMAILIYFVGNTCHKTDRAKL
jgi:hypothetical protein